MSCTSLDLTIDGALADPMIAAAMRADRVDPKGFEDLLRSTARTLEGARRPAALSFAFLRKRAPIAMPGSTPQW